MNVKKAKPKKVYWIGYFHQTHEGQHYNEKEEFKMRKIEPAPAHEAGTRTTCKKNIVFSAYKPNGGAVAC